MDLSVRLLGTRTTTQLRERVRAAVLQVGSDTFTRKDLAGVECFNFTAAASLTKILTDLHIKNCRDLFERLSPYDLALPRLGAISLAVLGAAFEQKGIGGDAPLEAWAQKHLDADHPAIRTFTTVKTERTKRDHLRKTRSPRRRARTQGRQHSRNLSGAARGPQQQRARATAHDTQRRD